MSQQQKGGDYNQFTTTSDDDVLMKQIIATHADGSIHKVNVRPHLQLIKEIFRYSTTLDRTNIHDLQVSSHMKSLDEKTQKADFVGMLEALAYTIHKISCEISYKCYEGEDAHSTTMVLFKSLSKFSWDAKVVMALFAFAVTHGEFWLVEELCETHPLAKSIVLLKQLPDVFKQSEMQRPRFESFWSLFKAMFDVTESIIQFHELPPQYTSVDQSPISVATAQIPIAVYWIIKSVVTCTSQIIGLTGLGSHKSIPSTIETSDLSSLAQKINNMHEHFTKQLDLCNQYIDEKKQVEAYNRLVQVFETTHVNNMDILKALFNYSNDDLQPLLQGFTGKRVGIEVLRGKDLFLLISDLYISEEELKIFGQIMNKMREPYNMGAPNINPFRKSNVFAPRLESYYQEVWLPVVDKTIPWTEAKQREFDRLQKTMPWYSVHHPSLINSLVIKYIKEKWHFNKKPILVVLEDSGRVTNTNALHMLWIWGSIAAGRILTSSSEKHLWSIETWGIKFLVDGIDENILHWMEEKERIICLYGGEDIDWIRKFTMKAREVAKAANISFEMMYVGKRNPNKELLRRNIDIITKENLSNCWEDCTLTWYFWIRLESMLYSKMKLDQTIENDPIIKEIMTILIFDSSSEKGWALISKGSEIMAKAKGDKFLNCFKEYDKWKGNVEVKGFIQAISDHLDQLRTPHHCNRLILPGMEGMIPEMLVCTECGCPMEKSVSTSVMYSCCNN
ncbi:protein SIEVE ELEMENT OCCLUSION B-like [Macadamia integrifolia]|uniref:protein SIEVE ELEMENT OCCLUSION B-like n=1 Tax=Macadamia integrifolia TaxID=60698 RepID=UPI001C4F6D1E|nr:protein SIEVE ELEMENT OCCLUSION B-like [Macadamia integrifolia]